MKIETVSDLAEQIADWIGIYGGCKAIGSGETGCTYDKFENPCCCRVGFINAMEERIREAVENDKKLEESGLK